MAIAILVLAATQLSDPEYNQGDLVVLTTGETAVVINSYLFSNGYQVRIRGESRSIYVKPNNIKSLVEEPK